MLCRLGQYRRPQGETLEGVTYSLQSGLRVTREREKSTRLIYHAMPQPKERYANHNLVRSKSEKTGQKAEEERRQKRSPGNMRGILDRAKIRYNRDSKQHFSSEREIRMSIQYSKTLSKKARVAASKTLEAILEGTTATYKGNAIIIDKQSTQADLMEIIYQIYQIGKAVTVEGRFAIGDAWNQLQGNRGVRLDLIQKKFGENCYNLFKEYGWIARKWPEGTRELEQLHGWTHYRENRPGQKGNRPPRMKTLTWTAELEVDGGIEFFMKDETGREFRCFRKDAAYSDQIAQKEEVGV